MHIKIYPHRGSKAYERCNAIKTTIDTIAAHKQRGNSGLLQHIAVIFAGGFVRYVVEGDVRVYV